MRHKVVTLGLVPGHGIVHHHDLFGRHTISLDNGIAGRTAHGHYHIGGVEPGALDARHLLVDVYAAAVVFRGVDVRTSGLPVSARAIMPAG